MKGCYYTSLEKYKSQNTTKKAAKEKSTGEERKEKNHTQNFNELTPFFNHWVRDVKNIDIEMLLITYCSLKNTAYFNLIFRSALRQALLKLHKNRKNKKKFTAVLVQ